MKYYTTVVQNNERNILLNLVYNMYVIPIADLTAASSS